MLHEKVACGEPVKKEVTRSGLTAEKSRTTVS